MAKRCKHERARLKSYAGGMADAYCDECGQGWFGNSEPWYSSRGKYHKPPKWVTQLIDKAKAEMKVSE